MSLTTALNGHVQSLNFFNRYKTAGGLIKIEQSIDQRNIQLSNSGNSWNSGGGMNLSAGGNISLVGAQINSQGYSASAGKNYEERAAYDISERVSNSSIKMSGIGTYLLDYANNHQWLFSGGQLGGRTETSRATNNVDSTRTATVTNINAGSGEVNRNVGGDAFIEGSIVSGALVNPLVAGGRTTLAAAVDTRHIENSTSSGTIRWQSTNSSGSIQQTLHMPQIHGTIPAGMSAYQGAGGVSVQLPAGSSVRATIEQLSQEPGKEYLKALGNRSDIDWQRVQALNKSLDFSKSGLTQEATLVVIIVVSLLTYGAASGWGTAVANTYGTAAGAAVTAGTTSLASTAAVSLINNQGDIGATLKELGSKENLQGLLLTMATAGLTQGILSNIQVDGATTLANVNAQSSIELLLARNAIQGISSAVLESAVMGTDLEQAIKNNLKGALINTVAAQGANQIGDAKLDGTSKAIAHALLGCAVGAATAGNSSGCAPGAAGGAIGELVASLYGNSRDLGGLEDRLNKDPNNAQLKAQVDQVRNTVTELAKLSGAGAALLIGGDATDMKTAMGTASNAAVNNYLNHSEGKRLSELQDKARNGELTPREADERQALIDKDARTNAAYTACGLSNSPECNAVRANYARAQASYLPEQKDIRAWAEKKAAAGSPYTVQQLVDAYNAQYSYGADALPKGTGDISDAADWVRSTIASDIKSGVVDGFDKVAVGVANKASIGLNVGLGLGLTAGAATGKAVTQVSEAMLAARAAAKVPVTSQGANEGGATKLPTATGATTTSPYSSSGTSYGKPTLTDVNGNSIATQPSLPNAGVNGGATTSAPIATGSPITTRFVNGVTIVDQRTGAIFNGTVDLQPTFDRIAAGATGLSRNDGTVFRNLPDRTTGQILLPVKPTGYYTEYVVPTPGINGPGPQRIVTGQSGEMFYTPDHYLTFIPVKKP